MQTHTIKKRYNPQILRSILSKSGRLKLLSMIISVIALPFILGFSPLLLDNIDIVAIRDLQLRQERGDYVLDTTIVIRNTTGSTLKLENCTFDLAFAFDNSEDIPLGAAVKDEILLEQQADSADDSTDTDVKLSVNLGPDIQKLQQTLMAKKEMALLLTQSKPKLNLHLQGKFDIGIKADRAWGYQEGITIDWIVKPEVQKSVLAKIMHAMISGTTTAATTPEAKPISPKAAASVTPEAKPIPDTIMQKITVYFASGAKALDDESKKALRKWVKEQQNISDRAILHVEGHTDSSGPAKQNQKISEKRANIVYYYLTKTLKMTWKQVVIKGFGETQPVATEDSEDKEAQARNRRVEVYVSYE